MHSLTLSLIARSQAACVRSRAGRVLLLRLHSTITISTSSAPCWLTPGLSVGRSVGRLPPRVCARAQYVLSCEKNSKSRKKISPQVHNLHEFLQVPAGSVGCILLGARTCKKNARKKRTLTPHRQHTTCVYRTTAACPLSSARPPTVAAAAHYIAAAAAAVCRPARREQARPTGWGRVCFASRARYPVPCPSAAT